MTIEKARRDGSRYLNPVPTSVGGLSTALKVLPKFLFGSKAKRSPQQPVGPFGTDPLLYQTPPATGLRVTWFGHSSLLVEMDGLRILIDPVWDERASPLQWLGPKRFFPPTLALRDLPAIDVILISHDHFDHLGAGSIRELAGSPQFAGSRWITALGVGAILASLGVPQERLTQVNWTECVEIATTAGALSFTALPARHFSGRSVFNRWQTLWASFAIIGPTHRVYYGADSGEWPGFAEIGAMYGPFDLTMLEIGAFDPLWADIHMGPDGAARSYKAMGSDGLLMPIHWGLFDLALHGWREPIERLYTLADQDRSLKVWSPVPGRPTDVFPNAGLRSASWR